MKLDFDEMKRFRKSFEDPMDRLLDEDGGKKKKKKKGKKKDKFKLSASIGREGLNESVDMFDGMKKKELRKYLENRGVNLLTVDTDSKKALRKECRKLMKKDSGEATPKKEKKSGLKTVTEYHGPVPYFYDEDTDNFTICDATKRTDMECFQSMHALGSVRKSKRADDGFAELMDRITGKLLETPPKSEIDTSKAIDVEYKVVDEPKALPAPATEAIELTPAETQQLSDVIDEATKKIAASRKKKKS